MFLIETVLCVFMLSSGEADCHASENHVKDCDVAIAKLYEIVEREANELGFIARIRHKCTPLEDDLLG